jgi:archaellum component FlaC
MEVNSVGTGTSDLNKVNEVKSEKQSISKEEIQQPKQQQQTTNQTDKLEISDEAKRMQTIENRLRSKFYDSEEVQQKTAQNIYRKIFKD